MTRKYLKILTAAVAATTIGSIAVAQPVLDNPQIDYSGFSILTNEVAGYRSERLVSLAQFQQLSRKNNAIILDTRSAQAFANGHLAGAVNLPFSDFTEEKLAKVIGDTTRPILIYCNNNFSNDRFPVRTKRAPLALNIPTFINLYGYGYKNIFELNQIVATGDLGDEWVQPGI